MTIYKKLLVVVLVMLVMVSLVGCGGGQKAQQSQDQSQPADTKHGGTLQDALGADPPGLDVQQNSMLETYYMARLLFSTLVRYKGGTTDLEPELLAEMPTVSSDGLTYHFKLKPDLKFSDGTPLTSKDVKFTFERMLKPETKAINQWVFDPIKGAKDMEDGKATELAGFKIINDQEFEITLEAPYAPFIQNLAVPCASIYPAEATQKAGEEWTLNPIGSGPYKIAEWVHDDHITLERNTNYFEKDLPYIDKIQMRIIEDEATMTMEFENGNIDILPIPDSEYPRLASDPNFSKMIVENTPLNTYFYVMNENVKYFQDVRVRKAIAMAIDKDKILKELLNNRGVVAKGLLGPGIPGYNENNPGFPYDPEQTRKLLAEAGYPNGFEVENWQAKSETFYKRNVAIQAMLKQVGIDMKINQMDSASWRQSRNNGKVPIYLANWWADIPDPDNYMYNILHSTQTPGWSINYKNPKVDEFIEKARVSTDMNERIKMYQEAEKIAIYDDVSIIPLFHIKEYYIVQPYVKDVQFHPTGIGSYNYRTMWLEKK
ncbi:ABC transporter substrate-binding protein [Thermoanaerobacteraceae bacterium SP2]|nr:ABC transporter substrate-binding protein [Thermoanaerobacteraceae bacterium SP2]